MKTRNALIAATLGMVVGGIGTLVFDANAADHTDSVRAATDPAADIADLYAWMNDDATKLNLVMTLVSTGQFSDAVDYVFHVNSDDDGPLGPTPQEETTITCTFDSAGAVTCEVGDVRRWRKGTLVFMAPLGDRTALLLFPPRTMWMLALGT